jgi:hypothetical protein
VYVPPSWTGQASVGLTRNPTPRHTLFDTNGLVDRHVTPRNAIGGRERREGVEGKGSRLFRVSIGMFYFTSFVFFTKCLLTTTCTEWKTMMTTNGHYHQHHMAQGMDTGPYDEEHQGSRLVRGLVSFFFAIFMYTLLMFLIYRLRTAATPLA